MLYQRVILDTTAKPWELNVNIVTCNVKILIQLYEQNATKAAIYNLHIRREK